MKSEVVGHGFDVPGGLGPGIGPCSGPSPFSAAQLQQLAQNPWSSNTLGKFLGLELHSFGTVHDGPTAGALQQQQKSMGLGLSTSDSGSKGKGGARPSAQKRFRERQKEKMSTLEQEVAAKSAEYERLTQENQQLKMRAAVLEKVVACRDEQLALLASFHGQCDKPGHPSSCFGGVSGSPVDPTQIESSPQAELFKRMTSEEVMTAWKKFLTDVTGGLLKCSSCHGDEGDPATLDEIARLVREAGYMMKHIMVLNPGIMRSLLTLNMESGKPSVAPASHWSNVIASVNLTEQQRTDILAVFDLYRGLIAKVYEERRLIMTVLGPSGVMVEGPGGAAVSRKSLHEEMELMDKLNVNLVKENSAQLMLMCFLLGKVLSAVQFSRVSVYSYPYWPDALALASTIAQQASYFKT